MTLQRTDLTRLFVLTDSETYHPDPVYINCVDVDGVSQSAGEISLAYAPDPELAGEFIEAGAYRTSKERATSTIILRTPIDEDTILAETQRRRCTFDIHLNTGVCAHPASIDQFFKKEIWEDVLLTTRTTSKLIGFDSSGVELVSETYGVSIKHRYTVRNPRYSGFYSLTCTDFGTNAGSLVVPPARCCGKTAGAVAFVGSASGNGMIGLTTNFGKDWECFDTESNQKLVGGSMWRKWAVFAGHNGYTYFINLSSQGFVDRTRCASPALIGFLSDGQNAVAVATDKLYVLVGESGFAGSPTYVSAATLTSIGDAKRNLGFALLDANNCVVWSKDGRAWSRSTAYADPADSTPAAIVVRGLGQWLISASDAFYYTNDYGVTWTSGLALPYPGPLYSASKHVLSSAGYDQENGVVRVFRTTDGNATWYEEPNLAGASLLPESIQPVCVRTAPEDPNIVWIAGFNPNGSCVALGRV